MGFPRDTELKIGISIEISQFALTKDKLKSSTRQCTLSFGMIQSHFTLLISYNFMLHFITSNLLVLYNFNSWQDLYQPFKK